jgi:hypothetical protein
MSRAAVRNQLTTFLSGTPISGVVQVHSSFPNRLEFQKGSTAGQKSRAIAVVFIESEDESRLAFGGATSGKKRIDYGLVVQVFHHSLQNDATDAMDDFDVTIDGIKNLLRSDHRFGDTSGTIVWQGAEPSISVSYGTPKKINGGATESWAAIRFVVTEMINA